jgi:hypothetical protein
MIVNYHARASVTTPDQLNAWLNSQLDGWTCPGTGPNRYAVARYACQNGVTLSYDGDKPGRNDPALDRYLCADDPVILWVNNAQHFVVATGKNQTTGIYLINDPGKRAFHDLSHYGSTYTGMFPFSSTSCPGAALLTVGCSPIELILTDPSGNKTGTDPILGETFNQIPNSAYTTQSIANDDDPTRGATPESKVLDVPTPADGDYSLDVIGTGTGPFSIDFFAYDSNGDVSVQTVTGNATAGSLASCGITYSASPGSGVVITAAQVRPPINSDGTSIFRARRGVIPVKFDLSQNGVEIRTLPPATLDLTRTRGQVTGTVIAGAGFRIAGHQYMYNLDSRALGVGMYRLDVKINGQVVGSAIFELR